MDEQFRSEIKEDLGDLTSLTEGELINEIEELKADIEDMKTQIELETHRDEAWRDRCKFCIRLATYKIGLYTNALEKVAPIGETLSGHCRATRAHINVILQNNFTLNVQVRKLTNHVVNLEKQIAKLKGDN